VLHVFGNCLTTGRPGYENQDFIDRIENMDDIVEDEYENGDYRGGVPIIVRGQALTVDARPGEEFQHVFRELVPEHRDLLLADETELRARIPADLPKVLQLEEWHQPDLFRTIPSASETYQMVAEVLVDGDVTHYRPSLPPNTHWSNWPESGSL
jgi:hypothetical protein